MTSLSALFKLTRFPLVFTAMADSAVGAALSGVNLFNCVHWAPAVASSAFLYAGGMVLNDICDIERDRTLHPERPLPSGRVSLKSAGFYCFVLLALAVTSAALAGRAAVTWALVIVALIAGYNRVLKRWAIPGSLAMAAVRGANFLLGVVVVTPDLAEARGNIGPCAAVLAMYVFFLTLWSTREDRPGCRAFPAGVGAAITWTPILAALRPAPARWAAMIPSMWILPWVIRAIARPDRDRMMQVVRWGVLGIIPLDASFLAVSGRWAEAAAVAALVLPALALLPVFRKL